MEIKKATMTDMVHLQEMAKTTFIQTFAKDNTPKDMERYIDNAFSLTALKSQMENPFCLFYLALVDKKMAAYMKLNVNNVQTEPMGNDAIELERIYVLDQFKGQNIGSSLLAKAVEIGMKMSKKFVWLGVWEHNPKAISFYNNKGFEIFDKHIFQLGDDEQVDYLMKLNL